MVLRYIFKCNRSPEVSGLYLDPRSSRGQAFCLEQLKNNSISIRPISKLKWYSLYFGDMNLSYWEYNTWLANIDFTIVGSGIVGLSCALQLRLRYPKAKIIVLEKGILPQGASTKNAGFACFGSISEILSDLEHHSEEEVQRLIRQRYNGIALLRNTLGDTQIDYQNYGGHELFISENPGLYQKCSEQLPFINALTEPIFGKAGFREHSNSFGFKNILPTYITNSHESQIDTGKMMRALVQKVLKSDITILNGVSVTHFSEKKAAVAVQTDQFEFDTRKLFIATNGFATHLIEEPVRPARAQVLITKPIARLHIKGTFHLDQGYYYFRNVGNSILLGGGRNLNFKGETTFALGETYQIQQRLEQLLKTAILPRTPFEIEHRWSGIMGVGPQKKPIVKVISDNIFCGVRLGGMGIAIGSSIGKELSDLL